MALYSFQTPLETTPWARQYYNHCRCGTGGSEFFLWFSPKFRPQKDGARIQLQNFWLQVQSSFLHTCSLTLLGLDFTVKGVEANLKVISFQLIMKYKLFCMAVTQMWTLIVAIPEKTLLCPLQCHLFRWLECISNTIWLWN